MGVPTMYVRLADDERLTPDLCRSIRLFASGSAALSPKTFDKFEERTGCRIVERYGMTETAINSSNPVKGEQRVGTVGRPLAGVALEIRDVAGTALPCCNSGAVHVRGPHVFLDYWGKPDQTAAVKSADGWFDTGDIGVLDADGYLTLVGRSKDLIISGGYNVLSGRSRNACWGAIRLSGKLPVVGLPHDDFGEAVHGNRDGRSGRGRVGIPRSGNGPGRSLPATKFPRKVLFVNELPRNHPRQGRQTCPARALQGLVRRISLTDSRRPFASGGARSRLDL